MQQRNSDDLSGLAALASNQSLDVRPVILRVQTDLFTIAPIRNRSIIASFELLATGLIPGIDDETAAIVAKKLVNIEETPQSVLDLLYARGGEAKRIIDDALGKREILVQKSQPIEASLSPESFDAAQSHVPDMATRPEMASPEQYLTPHFYKTLSDLLAFNDEDIDAAITSQNWIPLDQEVLAAMVDKGRFQPALALSLLQRDDVSISDKAMLYLHASREQRKAILDGIAPLVSLSGLRGILARRSDEDEVLHLVNLAAGQDITGFGEYLADMIGIDKGLCWRFFMDEQHDLLALGLLAADVPQEACERIFLTLHPGIARSLDTVFFLSHLVRSVDRVVALRLVELILGVSLSDKRQKPGIYIPAMDASGSLRGHGHHAKVNETVEDKRKENLG